MQAMQLEGERREKALKEADELHKKVFRETDSVGLLSTCLFLIMLCVVWLVRCLSAHRQCVAF